MRVAFIIVAGGKGLRMKSDKPKQYLELKDKPIIIETIANVSRQLTHDDQVIVVVPPSDKSYAQKLLEHFYSHREKFPRIEIVGGGATRHESVAAGLEKVSPEMDYIAVHDGVRPFVTRSLFLRLFDALNSGNPSVLPALPSDESIRLRRGDSYDTFPREKVFRIQTPQVFRAELLRKAYATYTKESSNKNQTDDAGIVEYTCGVPPYIIEGIRENIKITNPVDLAIARVILDSFDATR